MVGRGKNQDCGWEREEEGMFDRGIVFHGAAVSHSDQHEVRACELGKMGSDSPKASRNGNKNVCVAKESGIKEAHV